MKKKEISASDIKALMVLNYKRYLNGSLSESKAAHLNGMLANILKAFQAIDTEERLESIKEALRLKN